MADQDIRVEIKGNAADLRLAARSAIRDIRDVAQETRRADAQMVVSNEAAGRSLKKLEDRQAGLAQASRNFGASWRAIGWTALLSNVGPLTAGVADLGGAIVGAGTALAPLAGVAATLPSLFGAMGQTGLVATLAFRGMDKALQGDQKALKALTPEAQRFVTTIRGEVGPAVKDLQKISQAGLLPGVTAGVQSLMRDLPVVKQITADTAKELGTLAEKAGKQFSTKGFQADLKTFGEENVKVIGRLGDAGLHAADGFRHITIAAQPLVDDLSKGVDTLAGKFEAWSQKARQDGTLADFFDLTDTRVHQSLDILGGLAGTLLNVGKAAQPLAGHLMSGLVDDTQKLADITGSKAGQSTLAHFFSDAERPLHEVGKLARDLAVDLGKLAGAGQDPLAQLAHDARVDVLPAVSDLAQLLTRDLLPHVITLAGHLGHLFHDMEPGLKTAMPLVTGVTDELSKMVTAVDDLTTGLPGVAKLLPGLLVTAAVIRSWRLLGEAWSLAPGAVQGAAGVARGRAVVAAVPAVAGARAATTETVVAATAGSTGIRAGARSLINSPAARALGQSLALGAAAVFGPQFIEHIRTGAAPTSKDFGLPKHQKLDTGIPDLNPLHKAGLPSFDPVSIGTKVANTAFDKLIANSDKGKEKLKDFGDTAEDTFKRLQKAGDSRGMTQLADEARDLAKAFPGAGDKLRDFAGAVDSAAKQKVIPQFAHMKDAAGHSLKEILNVAASTTFQIEQDLGANTAAGKDALAHNFQLAVGAIKQSMADGKLSTETGLKEIRRLLTNELSMYGITGKQASNYLHGNDTVDGRPLNVVPGHAAGAMYVGRRGEKGRDNVPALLNGQPAIVARGELVGVFNASQQKALDGAAKAGGYGGLSGLMGANSRPHHMAGGGLVAAASGGFFPAAGTDYAYGSEPQIAARLDRLGKALGLHLTGISGHRTPQHSVEVGGFANDPHTRGQASDTPGIEGVAESVLERYGLTRPFAGAREADHIQLLGGSKAAGAAFAGAVDPIKRVKFPDGLGAISALGQKGLDSVRSAANDRLSGLLGAAGGPGGGGGGGGGQSSAGGRYDRAALEALWRRANPGLGDPHLMAAIALAESAGDPNAGHSHPYHGLWQVGPGGSFDPLTNAREAGQKLRTQGLGAWETYTNHAYLQFMASGGLIARMASTGDAILGTGDPIKPDTSKSKKKAKKIKTLGVPGLPGRVKPGKYKHQAAKGLHHSDIFKQLVQIPEFSPPDWSPFEDRADVLRGHIGAVQARADRRDDQQTLNLTVADALAAGLVSDADVKAAGLQGDDLVEVLNRAGGVDASDRKHHGGIAQHVADLDEVIRVRQFIIDMLGGGAEHGINTELGRMQFARGGYAGWAIAISDQLDSMRKFYEANALLRTGLVEDRDGLEHKRPKDWRERVKADRATIKRYRSYLSGLSGLPEGFKYDRKAVHDKRTQANDEIHHLEAEIRQLSNAKAKNVGAANIDRYERLGRHIQLIDGENTALDAQIAGPWDPNRGGAAKTALDTISGLRGNVKDIDSDMRTLLVQTIPSEVNERDDRNSERADWLGASAPALPKNTAPGGVDDSLRASLLQQLLDDAHKQHAIDTSQFDTLKAFAPLVNARYLGSFARGLAQVPADGMAMLHAGEAVVPAPDGPFGTWQKAGGDGVTVELHFADNSGQLVKLVDARVDGRSARVTSEQLGSRRRLFAAAPGRG